MWYHISPAAGLAYVLALTPMVSAFTRTTTNIGTDLFTRTVTDEDGSVKQTVSKSEFTTYIIIMNDEKQYSTFIGIPKTTTDRDGDMSMYLSPALYIKSKEEFQTFSDPTIPTPTSPQESTSTSGPGSTTGNETQGPSTAEAQKKDKNANVGAIAGGVVAGVLVVLTLGILGWFYKRKYDRRRQLEEHKKEEMHMLAMEIDGSYDPQKPHEGPFSESSFYASPRGTGSITDDLASRYTGGSVSLRPPVLRENYSAGAHMTNIGTELTMDSQGRLAMSDGSPLISESILPLRNVKAADNYTDLEWFPLVSGENELIDHAGPSYIQERELSHVAMYIQKTSGQKGISSVGAL
ncbi:hypothetical protein GGI07_005562 [Coemansia sp. Benny D115]|nr:hypothetical protein GGI07_005562 [Coemansia sp. Benny D115]